MSTLGPPTPLTEEDQAFLGFYNQKYPAYYIAHFNLITQLRESKIDRTENEAYDEFVKDTLKYRKICAIKNIKENILLNRKIEKLAAFNHFCLNNSIQSQHTGQYNEKISALRSPIPCDRQFSPRS